MGKMTQTSPPALAGQIRLQNLLKTYTSGVGEFTALRGIDLAVEPGEIVAVMGKSGSGKSPLLTGCYGVCGWFGGS